MNMKAHIPLPTDACQGIGRALALRLAKDEMDIAIVALTKNKMKAVAKKMKIFGLKAAPTMLYGSHE